MGRQLPPGEPSRHASAHSDRLRHPACHSATPRCHTASYPAWGETEASSELPHPPLEKTPRPSLWRQDRPAPPSFHMGGPRPVQESRLGVSPEPAPTFATTHLWPGNHHGTPQKPRAKQVDKGKTLTRSAHTARGIGSTAPHPRWDPRAGAQVRVCSAPFLPRITSASIRARHTSPGEGPQAKNPFPACGPKRYSHTPRGDTRLGTPNAAGRTPLRGSVPSGRGKAGDTWKPVPTPGIQTDAVTPPACGPPERTDPLGKGKPTKGPL